LYSRNTQTFSFTKLSPSSNTSYKLQAVLIVLLDNQQTNQSSHDFFLSFNNLLEQITELKETFIFIVFFIKDATNGPDEEIHRVRVCGRGCRAPLAPSECVTIQELSISPPWDVYGGFIT
jgi:hypothetical protein